MLPILPLYGCSMEQRYGVAKPVQLVALAPTAMATQKAV